MTILIEETNTTLKVTGHARREVCAMVTALIMGYVQNMEAETGEPLPHKIEDGYFYIDHSLCKGGKAQLLTRCLKRNLKQLSVEYPTMITYIPIGYA